MVAPLQRVLLWAALLVLAIAGGVQLIRPARTNPPVDPTRTLYARMSVPHDVRGVFERACRDCHSHETRWPWYSGVAPVSWFVIEHVNHGREHLNFSDWASYSPSKASELIEGTCKLTRDGSMPMGSYAWIHDEARLTPAEIDAICAWTSSLK